MDHPGAAGSSAGRAGQPAGAAVVVPVEAAAPAAPPAAARAWSVWTRVSSSTRVTWAGAAAPPASAGAAGALVAAARAPPAAWTPLSARQALAAALFLLGCAAAGLALFALILPPPDSRLLGKACAPPTDAEVASLRTAAECLLLAASALVVAATMGLLVPARFVAAFGNLVGLLTAYHAMDVLWKLVACHGSAHGALAFHFWVLYVLLWPAFPVCAVVSLR